jgi:hypothetical protein
MGLFKRKATPSVSWEKVRPHLDSEEREIDASDGWIVGRAVGDSVDHPCSVFLTDRTIYVDVRPQTLMPEPELIAAPFRDVLKIGVAANHVGGTRLMFVFDPDRATRGGQASRRWRRPTAWSPGRDLRATRR